MESFVLVEIISSSFIGGEGIFFLMFYLIVLVEVYREVGGMVLIVSLGFKYYDFYIVYGMIFSNGNEIVVILWFWVNFNFFWFILNFLIVLKWLIYGSNWIYLRLDYLE